MKRSNEENAVTTAKEAASGEVKQNITTGKPPSEEAVKE